MPRVLHVLSQRPSLTGSGVTLDALVRRAAESGWQQRAVVGVPAEEPRPDVGELTPEQIHAVPFGTGELPFPVPGMSDVMPYPSTRFSAMSEDQVTTYLAAWRRHLGEVVEAFHPQVIHSHHLWLVSSIIKELAPATALVIHCHATGLRQLELCPQLADRIRSGCARADRFVVLHRAQQRQLSLELGVDERQVREVGAGYRTDLFHARDRSQAGPPRLLYVGKLSSVKGLPCLLDAVEVLASAIDGLELAVVGSGTGGEADALRRRMRAMSPTVTLHGQLSQAELADHMRSSTAVVLPSFFEGLPLVLVEAFACGCRVVATALPGVVGQLAPRLGDAIELVEPPGMLAIDTPDPSDLPAFTRRLHAALGRTLTAPPLGDPAVDCPQAVDPFTWQAVFSRVEAVWNELIQA